jgi:hypothetical protein
LYRVKTPFVVQLNSNSNNNNDNNNNNNNTFVTNVQGEVFANVQAVAVKLHRLCGIDCLACEEEFFMKNPLDVKENENALDFSLLLSRLFSVSVSLDFPCTVHALFPERLSNHCQGIRRTFSEICRKF